MNIRLIPALASALLAMLGCSSPSVEQAQTHVQRYVIPRPDAPPPEFKACQLGKSCLALDSRPFEPCLLSSTRCADKVQEPLLVTRPSENAPPPEITRTKADK